jgi:hypothetical protein
MPETGKREITDSRLSSFSIEKGHLNFLIMTKVKMEASLPLFFYSEVGQFIFKTKIHELKNANFIVSMPSEIHMLEDPEINLIKGSIGIDLSDIWKTKRLQLDESEGGPDVMKVKSLSERSSRDQEWFNQEFGNQLSLDEEEKLFAGKRESPRARPKVERRVKVAKVPSSGSASFKLFDLSRGGMAFIVDIDNENEFSRGQEVHILGFDEFDLDDPIIGKVMSVRPIDENQLEFKVGVKFDVGQD